MGNARSYFGWSALANRRSPATPVFDILDIRDNTFGDV